MPIIDLQRRLREAGRIRIGEKVSRNGKTYPGKLETFRLTSADERSLGAAAALYGGEVKRWADAPVGEQYELVTGAKRLPIVMPPGDTCFSQWYETWSGGGCTRRCDGRREVIGDQPCVCDPDNRECKPHTRLSVILADLPGVGVWRLDTQGWYAATELAGTVDILRAMNGAVVAWLVLEQRQVKRPGEPTKNFPVVALDLDLRVRDLMAPQGVDAATGEIVPITPVPALPAPSVQEQMAVVAEPRPSRKRTATLPPTGLAPRRVADVAAAIEVPIDDMRALHDRIAALDPSGQTTYAEEKVKFGFPDLTAKSAHLWTADAFAVARKTVQELEDSAKPFEGSA